MWQLESDWLHALPLAWMAVVVFGGTYLAAVMIYAIVAGDPRARAFLQGRVIRDDLTFEPSLRTFLCIHGRSGLERQ